MARDAAKKVLVVNPEEAEVIRRIYAWYLSGLGSTAITDRLNTEGPLYRGKRWCKNRILDIIGDEAYVGRYYFKKKDRKTNKLKPKSEWIEIKLEPIVDLLTWEKTKALKQERDPTAPGSQPLGVIGSKTLLTGLAYCGLCGSSMVLETARGGKWIYYNCSNYMRRGRSVCRGQRIPAQLFERTVLDHMANKLFTTERVRAILKGV